MMHRHCKRIILNISCRVFQVKFENKTIGEQRDGSACKSCCHRGMMTHAGALEPIIKVNGEHQLHKAVL